MRFLARSLAIVGLGVAPLRLAAFDHSHGRFADVLGSHERGGLVDYAALKANPKPLEEYLNELAAVMEPEFDRWTQAQQLAFLINLYNAATLELVAKHYPVTSIKRIGGVWRSPWKLKVVRLWGEVTTLDHVEHEILRARYTEPRIHFALVCAARGCPPLRAEPYVADRLDAQLNDQARRFMAETDKNRFDRGTRTLYLSPIFKWFAADFASDRQSLVAFLRRYLPDGDTEAPGSGEVAVKYTDYDWSLNDVRAQGLPFPSQGAKTSESAR